MTNRGALIVFEGCDRAGKSTQSKKLLENLQQMNIQADSFTFPDRSTKIGQVINDYLSNKADLNDEVIHLLFSANRWEHVPKIMTNLQKGHTCILDRYSYSGIAYSAAKKNMSYDWCIQPELGLPEPDAIFFLTLNDEESANRKNFGVERYEQVEFQKRVRGMYDKVKETFTTKNSNCKWIEIDANQDIEKIQKIVLNESLKIINKIKNTPIGRLIK